MRNHNKYIVNNHTRNNQNVIGEIIKNVTKREKLEIEAETNKSKINIGKKNILFSHLNESIC